MLESDQNNVLPFISFEFNSPKDNVLNVLLYLITVVYCKFRNCCTNCYPVLLTLSLIHFKTNNLNTRNSMTLYSISSKKNYIVNYPTNPLMNAGNTYVFDYI